MPWRSASDDDRLGQEDDEVRAAFRFGRTVMLAGLAFVVMAVLWVGSCEPSASTVACGKPYRALLAVGGPAILAGGGLRAFLRTYQVWRMRGTWWGWQGVGWFLMTLMVLVMFISTVPVLGVE